MFISIRWEAILWVVTGSIFRRLSKNQKRPFCKLLALGSARLLWRNKIKSSQISQFFIFFFFFFFFFFTEMCWESHQVNTSTAKSKQAKPIFHFFFINQTVFQNMYEENIANFQNWAGWDFLWWCAICRSREIISKAQFPAPAAFHIIIILNKNNLFEFKHVDGPDESSMCAWFYTNAIFWR